MAFLDKIITGLFQGAEKISDVTEKIVETGKKVRSEGVGSTKELFTNISQRTSDVTALARRRYELASLSKQLETEFIKLGSALVSYQRSSTDSRDKEIFAKHMQKIEGLENKYKAKQYDYEQLRKKHSSDFVVNKLSEDLASANAIIDNVTISQKSNVVNKLLKEILLPKEALVSAIKREEEVIIPDGNTMLKAGDQVIVIGKKDDVEKIVKRFSAT